MTVIASVEQTYWEVVFANENLKVAEAALKAAGYPPPAAAEAAKP